MDSVSLLPIELAQNIFKFLDIKELYRCMCVCKSWRSLINCNYVWNHFYKVYDIKEIFDEDDEDSCETKALSPLCSCAIELKRFLLSPGFNWKFRRSKSYYVNLKYRHWEAVCYEHYIGVLYPSCNELHIYRCFSKSVKRIDIMTIKLSLISEIDLNVIKKPVSISKKYIAISAYNVTAVYKFIEDRFILYKCFASRLGNTNLIYTEDGFDDFIEEHLMKSSYWSDNSVFETILNDDVLWVSEISGKKHIINLITGEQNTRTDLFMFTKVLQHSPYLLNLIEHNISITDINGMIISSFDIPYLDNMHYMNKSILVIVFPVRFEGPQIPDNIQCREIPSGKLIRTFSVSERNKVAIHPKKPILYLFSTQTDLYKVTALCIQTGDVIWTYETRCGPHMFWGAFMSVISERFLCVYPAPSSDDYYALFSLDGELLYEDVYFTSGTLLHFSESVVLGKEEGRLHVTTFF